MKKKPVRVRKKYPYILLAIVVCGLLYPLAYVPYREKMTEQEERQEVSAWVQNFLGELADKWDPGVLRDHAHQLLLNSIVTSGHNMNDEFQPLSQLGKMRKDNCVLVNYATAKAPPDRFALAMFNCTPEYEHGNASLNIELKQNHIKGRWRVTEFSFNTVSIVQAPAPVKQPEKPVEKPPERKGINGIYVQ